MKKRKKIYSVFSFLLLCSGSVILRIPDQAQFVFPDMAARHAAPQFLEHFRFRTDRAVQRGTYHLIKISQQIKVL